MKKILNPWKGIDGYMCFGCSPENPAGLHMEFYEDDNDIVAIWKPNKYVQGWLNTLHGGIQCVLMDELGAWVLVRKLQTVGVTSRLEAKYMKRISTNEPQITIRGRFSERKRNAIFIETEILNAQNELCTSAKMVYFVASPERAANEFFFTGCQTEDEI